MIPRLPPAVRAIVKAAQPFNTMPKHPKIEPLFILNDLWNQDKHRNLSTIAAAVEVPFIAYTGDVDVRITEFAGSDIELHQDTKVVTFTIDGPKAEEMEVDPHFTYQVRREGRPFVETIRSIARTAYRLVNECETGQPTPLLSFSPI